MCHFSGNVQSYYGTPILVKIRNSESIKAVRNRIREILDVSEKVNLDVGTVSYFVTSDTKVIVDPL